MKREKKQHNLPHQIVLRPIVTEKISRVQEEENNIYAFEVKRSADKHAIKDAIEALGIPHVEVDLILVDGRSVGFTHTLQDGERIAVYPVFESLDISPVTRLRERPLRSPRFICDVHLGKLARRLRLLGFDTLYRDDYDDPEIARLSAEQKRCVLTRDVGLLKRTEVERGYWLRSTEIREQLTEVVTRLDLANAITPFTRCTACNGPVAPVKKADIEHRLEPQTRQHYDDFKRCLDCDQLYWKGSHYDSLLRDIRNLRNP